MKIIASAITVALVLCGAACDKNTTQGPGGKRLTLTQPADQTLKRGETNEIAISIGRDNFTGPVQVRFEKLPRGVEAVQSKDIAADQTRVVYTLHAANDADLVQKHEAVVVAQGPEGMATRQTFLVTVEDKP